jgi:hypothetical protein
VNERFVWGRVIERFDYDFDGQRMELVKFHPWKSERGTVRTGDPDTMVTQYHCDKMSESFWCIDDALIAWIARKNLGLNQHALVAGICRALETEQNRPAPPSTPKQGEGE